MVSARTQISVCLGVVILIAVPVFTVGVGFDGGWNYPVFCDIKPAFPIGLAVVAVLSLALLSLCRTGRRTAIFALGFTVVWVLLLLPETQYILSTRDPAFLFTGKIGSYEIEHLVESFDRRVQLLGYILVLFPVPFVLFGLWLRRSQSI
jgi:hypothetical protein